MGRGGEVQFFCDMIFLETPPFFFILNNTTFYKMFCILTTAAKGKGEGEVGVLDCVASGMGGRARINFDLSRQYIPYQCKIKH